MSKNIWTEKELNKLFKIIIKLVITNNLLVITLVTNLNYTKFDKFFKGLLDFEQLNPD